MRDQQRLMLSCHFICLQKFRFVVSIICSRVGCPHERPIEAQMLNRIFRRAAAGPDAGFLLEELGIAVGPQHLVNGRWDMIIGEVMRA